MFTGIIEYQGEVEEVISNGSNRTYWIKSGISDQLAVDESICHDGVCLTVEERKEGKHRVTAISETLEKTTINGWHPGYIVNLERAMQMNGRLDGHIVQGHVDGTATCTGRKERNGSTEFTFSVKKKFGQLLIEKGSVCLNGVSLTAFNVEKKKFTVAIIPYTMEHTNISKLVEGAPVNIEFDILGKYVSRILSLQKK